MKFWGSSEAIISKTLQLLSDLSIGYPFVFVDDFKVGGSVAESFKAQVLKSSVPEFNSHLNEQEHRLNYSLDSASHPLNNWGQLDLSLVQLFGCVCSGLPPACCNS